MITSSVRKIVSVAVLLASGTLASGPPLSAQSATATPPQTQQPPPPPPVAVAVTVVGTMPLVGVELPISQIPAPVQTATGRDIENSAALDLSDFLNRRTNGVHVNETQGNPLQPDVNYRGYTASPLLGTPQGLSIYMDGVRLNQPFGEVVSWDLIPRIAIASTTLMPGSNPLFGLNTLGGALSVQTKSGRTARGTKAQVTFGSSFRRAVEVEHGGADDTTGLQWYVAGNAFGEDGWRDDSQSRVGQLFGKIGWQRGVNDVGLTVSHADNSLTGNGLQAQGLLDRDYSSIYTKPDETDNRSTLLNLTTRQDVSPRLTLSGNAYFRRIRTNTLNGDINEDSLDQAVYQPSVAERAVLATAGFPNVPASGLSAANTPYPSLRCIANVLLQDEPAEKCNGLLNRNNSLQRNGGLSGQIILRRDPAQRQNQFTVGAAYDHSTVDFGQSTELGYLNPDRSVTGLDAFGDGETGGDADGEPFDTRVDLSGRIRTWSVYASDTFAISDRLHVTASGRFNRTTVRNRDRIQPGGGSGSLDGDHVFSRFNPSAGVTFSPSPAVNLYAGYSEGSRAATSIELGCADPEEPCKLPNALAGDPPLDQVVTRTWEAGARGERRGTTWEAGVFNAVNRDDILFVTSEQTGFGYFRNFGRTGRRGFELAANRRFSRVSLGGGYTFLRATFESAETVNGESNSSNDEASEGELGLEGTIEIEPGDRIPLVPSHMVKLFGDVQVTRALALDVNLIAVSSSFARGNENNRHEPDGLFYLGDGSSPGYIVVNLASRYSLTRHVQVLAQVTNLFNRHYTTGAQLGPAGITDNFTYAAREFPAVNGEFPVRQTTFLAPGAPARVWVGTRISF